MKLLKLGMFALVLCEWGVSLEGGDKALSTDYKFRVDRFAGLSEEKCDQACEEILKTHTQLTVDLMRQLRQNPPDEAKVYLIYLLGELREDRAVVILADHIDLKAPRIDPRLRPIRWGEYPAVEALTSVGETAAREISSRLPKDQTDLRRKLMVAVIRNLHGEKCGRILLEGVLSNQGTEAGKSNMKASLAAFDALANR